MKNPIILLLCTICAITTSAQVGIGTTTPNSTLDINGSLATKITSFSANYTAGATDYHLIFTGTSAATLTLPTASSITGRTYTIKNASSDTAVLTINTTSSQTIDGATSQVMGNYMQTMTVISDGSNWKISNGNGTGWLLGGNVVSTEKALGTLSNHDLPIIANGTELMRFFASGNVSVGSDTLDPDSPEVFRVDGGSSTTYNLINGVGNRNGYLQFNIQNLNNGNFASSDIVATANNGTESTVYIDMGINSQGYSSGNSSILNGSNTAYIYSTGGHFYIGNGAQNKDLVFFTNAGATGADGTERMRITGTKITMRNDLYPEYNNNFSLGSSTLKWTAVYATNGTIQTSDRRLKTNIRKLPYGLKEVMEMSPVEYNWKTNPNGEHKIGLIAQDVRQLIPEVVVGDETKENIGMNYAELVPVLINAIKEQQKQIEELKKKVKRLERK